MPAGRRAWTWADPAAHIGGCAELRVVVIHQWAQFTGITRAETFFEPLALHLQTSDLLEQVHLPGLPLVPVPGLPAHGDQLAGAIEQLPFPLAQLDRSQRDVHCLVQLMGDGRRRSPESSCNH